MFRWSGINHNPSCDWLLKLKNLKASDEKRSRDGSAKRQGELEGEPLMGEQEFLRGRRLCGVTKSSQLHAEERGLVQWKASVLEWSASRLNGRAHGCRL